MAQLRRENVEKLAGAGHEDECHKANRGPQAAARGCGTSDDEDEGHRAAKGEDSRQPMELSVCEQQEWQSGDIWSAYLDCMTMRQRGKGRATEEQRLLL